MCLYISSRLIQLWLMTLYGTSDKTFEPFPFPRWWKLFLSFWCPYTFHHVMRRFRGNWHRILCSSGYELTLFIASMMMHAIWLVRNDAVLPPYWVKVRGQVRGRCDLDGLHEPKTRQRTYLLLSEPIVRLSIDQYLLLLTQFSRPRTLNWKWSSLPLLSLLPLDLPPRILDRRKFW